MKRYRLPQRLWPADSDGAQLPTAETLLVTGMFDQAANEAWIVMCIEATRGRFGPFNASELQLAWRSHFPAATPRSVTSLDRALDALHDLGVIEQDD